MIIAVLSLTLFLQENFLADDLLMHVGSSYALARRRDGEQECSVSYLRDGDHAGLRIGLRRIHGDPAPLWRAQTTVSSYRANINKPTVAPSGYPLGDRVTFFASAGSLSIFSHLDFVSGRSNIAYAGVGPRGGVQWRRADPEGDRILLEGLTRNGFAKHFGRRLHPAPNVTVNGVTITNVQREPAEVVMVPLGQWANARRIALGENERLGTFSFTQSGTLYIVPLAAKSVKKGANWRDLDAPVLKVAGSTYIPLLSMQTIVQ